MNSIAKKILIGVGVVVFVLLVHPVSLLLSLYESSHLSNNEALSYLNLDVARDCKFFKGGISIMGTNNSSLECSTSEYYDTASSEFINKMNEMGILLEKQRWQPTDVAYPENPYHLKVYDRFVKNNVQLMMTDGKPKSIDFKSDDYNKRSFYIQLSDITFGVWIQTF